MNERKVVITGMEMVSSLGVGLETSWNNIVAGKSGVRRITHFDPKNNITQIAGEIPDGFDDYARTYIPKRFRNQMTRVTQMAVACAHRAIEDAHIDLNQFDKTRCAVILGVIRTGCWEGSGTKSIDNLIVKEMSNAPCAWISIDMKFEGPCYPVSTACASSAYAIGIGYDLIRQDKADLVIVGGTDSHITPDIIEGFNKLLTLSVKNETPELASRPFSADRDGFVMGEGAGILILESTKTALSRNAKIYATIEGYSFTNEAHNIVSPSPDGDGMAKTMEAAIKAAGIEKGRVDYINAHGTSTFLNDKYETQAIKRVFGEHSKNLAVSSSKSMIGHTLGAAGALETIITAMSIHTQTLTPTINYNNPDAELDLDYVPNQSRNSKIDIAMSNSFGFGGHNATIVLGNHSQQNSDL